MCSLEIIFFLSGHRSAGGEQLHCASLVLYTLLLVVLLSLLLLFSFHFCPNKQSLSQPTGFRFFLIFFSIQEREGRE